MDLPNHTVRAIAAMAEDRTIGDDGSIPWHIPADFKFFKEMTMGATLVMGRKTFESIGRPLPGRKTIVLTRKGIAPPGVQIVSSIEQLSFEPINQTLWICGGSEIYEQLLPVCRDLLLSRIHGCFDGDSKFPKFEHLFEKKGTVETHPDFSVERWVKT